MEVMLKDQRQCFEGTKRRNKRESTMELCGAPLRMRMLPDVYRPTCFLETRPVTLTSTTWMGTSHKVNLAQMYVKYCVNRLSNTVIHFL